jgi:hypothetical protein
MQKIRRNRKLAKSKKVNTKPRRIKLTTGARAGHSSTGGRILHELQNPSVQARSRWHAIPLLFGDAVKGRQISGRVGYDSWSTASVGLRDIDSGHVRHLRFDSGPVKVEVVAERRSDGWEFVARVYVKDDVAHHFVLEAGRRRILPHSDGFYLWSSKFVLRKLRLIAFDRQIEFGGIKW